MEHASVIKKGRQIPEWSTLLLPSIKNLARLTLWRISVLRNRHRSFEQPVDGDADDGVGHHGYTSSHEQEKCFLRIYKLLISSPLCFRSLHALVLGIENPLERGRWSAPVIKKHEFTTPWSARTKTLGKMTAWSISVFEKRNRSFEQR